MNKSFTQKITKKNIFYIILICFILSVIPLYVIGMYAHPSVDDYYYGTETVQVWNETHSFASVVKCSFDEMINTYNIWQGNFSAIFLMRLQPGIFGEQYYFIAPLILLSAYMGFSIFFFYTALKKIFKADSYLSATVGICLTFVSMQLCATPSDSFYWFNGAIYYTFFYSLMLFLFALLIRMRTAKAAGTIILTAISSVSAFLIGGSNYAAALFMCIILALSAGSAVYFVILRKNKVIRPYHMAAYIIVAAAAMAGLFISMAAPGNALRQQSVGGSTGIVKTFVYTFAFGGYSIAKVLNAPCLIFFICMIPVFYRIARRSGFTYRYPLLVAVFTFGLYCSMGTPVFYAQGLRMPYRMMNIIFFAAYVLITFNLIYFLGWIGNKIKTEKRHIFLDDIVNNFFEKIKAKGIDVANVTLHVGIGTFRPVKVEDVLEHDMHSEYYMVTQEAADKINKAKESGKRVITVGTTSTRTIESVADENGKMKADSGWTKIFIYPGYEFKVVDNLITNFHLPESTLIMLVSALAGKENVLNAYECAVENKYRFFSFGDAMFIK